MKLFTTVGSLFLVVLLSTKAFSQCTAPPPPVVTNDTVDAPGGVAILTATGDSVRWYDASGGTPVASGNTFTTPTVTATTTYYATNVVVTGGEVAHGGMPHHTGSLWPTNNNQNAQMQFTVHDTSTLVSVKVYTDFPGNRVFKLYDSNNNLVAFDTVFVNSASPNDSMVVELNFPLSPGTGYYLTTDSAVNQLIPNNNNYTGPRFRRNSSNVFYPYNIDTLVTITGNNVNSAQYFYFYDWVVQTPVYTCESEPAAAEVFYDNSIGVSNVAWSSISLFPNPATNAFYVKAGSASTLRVIDISGRVLIEETLNGSDLESVDVSNLSQGMYTVKVQTQSGERVAKLMIQR